MKGFHIEEETFEKNFKLRTLDGNYDYLAELLSDSNMISLIVAKFKGFGDFSFKKLKCFKKYTIYIDKCAWQKLIYG